MNSENIGNAVMVAIILGVLAIMSMALRNEGAIDDALTVKAGLSAFPARK